MIASLFSHCYLLLEKSRNLSKPLILLGDCPACAKSPPCFFWKISLLQKNTPLPKAYVACRRALLDIHRTSKGNVAAPRRHRCAMVARRLIPPSYVKPFVKRQKSDAADAEAICEASQRPTMRFVIAVQRWPTSPSLPPRPGEAGGIIIGRPDRPSSIVAPEPESSPVSLRGSVC